MYLYKCDICKKVITKRDYELTVEYPALKRYHLCEQCGIPITLFLKQRGLLKEERRK